MSFDKYCTGLHATAHTKLHIDNSALAGFFQFLKHVDDAASFTKAENSCIMWLFLSKKYIIWESIIWYNGNNRVSFM